MRGKKGISVIINMERCFLKPMGWASKMTELKECMVEISYGGRTIHVPATEELFALFAKVDLAKKNLEVAEQNTGAIARRISSHKRNVISYFGIGKRVPQPLYDEQEGLVKERSICSTNLQECEAALNIHTKKVLDALSTHNKV